VVAGAHDLSVEDLLGTSTTGKPPARTTISVGRVRTR